MQTRDLILQSRPQSEFVLLILLWIKTRRYISVNCLQGLFSQYTGPLRGGGGQEGQWLTKKDSLLSCAYCLLCLQGASLRTFVPGPPNNLGGPAEFLNAYTPV